MQAYLFDDFKVEIDERCTVPGHCWHGRYRDGIPAKLTSDLERFFYKATLEYENPIVLDIGANDGVFSMIAAVNPHMRCFAFEPAPRNYDILQRNISLNHIEDRVQTFQLALADQKGAAILKVPSSGEEDGLACIGNPLRFKDWVEFEVPVTTVDDFVRGHGIDNVDLIKIDTEGCELLVLRGAEDLITRCRPAILCEYHKTNARQFGCHPDQITELLESWGYQRTMIAKTDAYFHVPKPSAVPLRESLSPGYYHGRRPRDGDQPSVGMFQGSSMNSADSSRAGETTALIPREKVTTTMYDTLISNDLRECVDLQPERLPEVLKWLCADNRGHEALTVVSYALEKYPDSPDLYNLRAELMHMIGKSDDARKMLLSLVERWPDHARALNNLGVILATDGNIAHALKCFTRSLEIDPYDRNTVSNYAGAVLGLQQVDKAAELLSRYTDRFPNDVQVRQLLCQIKGTLDSPRDSVQSIRLVSQYGQARRDTTKIIMTSGVLGHYNGGTKIYNTWVKLLRKSGFDAFIASVDGKYEPWLVDHQPVVSYAGVNAYRDAGHDVRIVSSWLDTPGLEQLIAEGQFYYFDAELKWTLQFRDKLDYYLGKGKIAGIATHSRYMQSWYMANYGIKPTLINEWSDESVFYEDAAARVPGRIGCMPDSSPEDTQAFDFLAERIVDFGRGAELIKITGDEHQVADLLRTADIFVGLNPGKHPFWGEGCPRTQQEALHCGCVLAAYDCLGNREYLYDNWTGLMVPSGDAQALWQAVKSLLDDPDLKERLRTGGRNIAAGLFSERNKYKLVSSFLQLPCDAPAQSPRWITKEELASIFPRPFWLNEAEVPFLARMASEARNTIVEIGCAYGGSTAVYLLNKNSGVQLHSIDPFIPDSKGGVQANMQDCRDAVAQALLKKDRRDAFADWHLINGYSHDIAPSWNKEIDLLFIDGSHHYEDVKRDFQQWSGFLAPDGRILIHDSRKDNMAEDPSDEKFSRGWTGPTRFVEELKSSPDFELVDTCYSISVFARR